MSSNVNNRSSRTGPVVVTEDTTALDSDSSPASAPSVDGGGQDTPETAIIARGRIFGSPPTYSTTTNQKPLTESKLNLNFEKRLEVGRMEWWGGGGR